MISPFFIPCRATLLTLLFAAAGCSDSPVAITQLVPGPISLTIVDGDGQTGLANTELPAPLVVKVIDAKDHPVNGQIVNFRVVQGGGLVYAGSSLTNKNGIAQEWWTLGSSGLQAVEVRAVDPTTGQKKLFAIFNATVAEPPPAVTPDSYEPNNFQGSRDFGAIANGQTFAVTANIHSATDVDWYRFRTVESGSACFPGGHQDFTLRVTLGNADLFHGFVLTLYDGPTLIQQITTMGGTALYVHRFTGSCGTDDGRTFDIKVERFVGNLLESHYEASALYTEG